MYSGSKLSIPDCDCFMFFSFQLFEWVQSLRVAGILPWTSSSPALCALANELGLPCPPKPKTRVRSAETFLKRTEIDAVVEYSIQNGNLVGKLDVQPSALSQDVVTDEREDRRVSWHNKSLGVLKANLLVTRFMAKSIFHLFGYRNKQLDKTHLLLYNRERVSKNEMYQNEQWY